MCKKILISCVLVCITFLSSNATEVASDSKGKPDVIFLSWDGTVADSMPNLSLAFGMALTAHGITIDELNHIKEGIKKNKPDYLFTLWDLAYRRMSAPSFEAMKKDYLNFYKNLSKVNFSFITGAPEFLSIGSRLGIPQIILSNRNGDSVRFDIANSSVAPFLTAIFGEGDVKAQKPSGDYAVLAAKKAGISYKKCWFIASTHYDIDTGINSGCETFYIGKMRSLPQGYREMLSKNKFVVTDYTGLQKKLLQLEL